MLKEELALPTRFELAISALTGRRVRPLHHESFESTIRDAIPRTLPESTLSQTQSDALQSGEGIRSLVRSLSDRIPVTTSSPPTSTRLVDWLDYLTRPAHDALDPQYADERDTSIDRTSADDLLRCERCGAISTDWIDWGSYIEANCDCPPGRVHLNWTRRKAAVS